MRPAGDRRIRRVRNLHVESTGRRVAAAIRRRRGNRVCSDREGIARDNGGAAGIGVRNGQRVSSVTGIRRGGRAPGDRSSGGGRCLCGVAGSVAAGVYVGVVMRPAGDRRIRRVRDRHAEGTSRGVAAAIRRSGGNRMRSDSECGDTGSDGGAVGISVPDGKAVGGVTRIRRGGISPGNNRSGRGGCLSGIVGSVATGIYILTTLRSTGNRGIGSIRHRHRKVTGCRVAVVVRRRNGNNRVTNREGRPGSDTVGDVDTAILVIRRRRSGPGNSSSRRGGGLGSVTGSVAIGVYVNILHRASRDRRRSSLAYRDRTVSRSGRIKRRLSRSAGEDIRHRVRKAKVCVHCCIGESRRCPVWIGSIENLVSQSEQDRVGRNGD